MGTKRVYIVFGVFISLLLGWAGYITLTTETEYRYNPKQEEISAQTTQDGETVKTTAIPTVQPRFNEGDGVIEVEGLEDHPMLIEYPDNTNDNFNNPIIPQLEDGQTDTRDSINL